MPANLGKSAAMAAAESVEFGLSGVKVGPGRSHLHALSTHRNTVKYRLQRIREISGFDLADPDARFNLQLATRPLQTLTPWTG